MTTTTHKQPKSLFYRLVKIGLIGLLLLLLAVVGLCVYGVWYVNSDKVKTFDNLTLLGGGSLSVGAVSISDVWNYPELDLVVCDLRVWEEDRTSVDSAFFVMDEGRIRLRADLYNSDTILLRQITYQGGRLHLLKDSQNEDAAGRMLSRRPKQQREPRYKIIGSPDLVAGIQNLDFRFANSTKGKDYTVFVNDVSVSKLSLGITKKAQVDFDVDVKGITFKASEGAYAQHTRLQGVLDFQHSDSLLSILIPNLIAGTTAIDFAATIYPEKESVSLLRFDIPEADMELIRPMLSPGLQAKVVDYNVEGAFPAKVKLYRTNERGIKPEVHIDLQLRGNRAKVQEYTFENTYLNGTFYNRLPTEMGHFKPDVTGSTVVLDTISAKGFGFDISTAGASIISTLGKGPVIKAVLNASGPAKSLSDLLKNDQYLFTKGTVDVFANLKGSLSEMTQLLDQSNCKLSFNNPSIRFVEAGVQLPLKQLTLDKIGNAATVDLQGITLEEKHSFHIAGEINGLSRVIGGANPAPIQTAVKVESPRLDWGDLAAYLGTKSHQELLEARDTSVASTFDPASLKAVLSLIENSFQPKLEISIDTFSCIDVVLNDFRTGMHFQGHDTMVLERTSFLLDTAKVSFGGSVDIGDRLETNYQFSLKAKHVDVEKLLPNINYLNSKILSELRTLPNDVDIEIEQLGFIHDENGILPNSSTGFIDLVSNKKQAFSARVEFEPDRPEDLTFNSTHVWLKGNAILFNEFFETEDFLFQTGSFDFYMAYAGLVPDIRTLVENEEMTLGFRDGQVLFKSADLEIPIKSLNLETVRDTASVQLFLKSEELGQELSVRGVANNLSEVVLGESGKQFSTQTLVESKRIVWSDLNTLIGTFSGERETNSELNLRKTIRALMKKFCPDIKLHVDELQLNDLLAIQDVRSGILMDKDHLLHIDTTGFTYGKGSMKLAGSVNLEDLSLTPFDLYLNTEELDVASILVGFDHFGIPALKEAKVLEGKANLTLNLSGDIEGDGGMLRPGTSEGVMDFSFYDLEVDGLKQIDDIAKKFRMTDRLDDLKFAPLSNTITLDTNLVHLPLMEIPSSAFRVYLAGDLEIGKKANFWVSVPLTNVKYPDSIASLKPVGYSSDNYKVHLEFAKKGPKEPLVTKLRLSNRKYYKQRKNLTEWRIDKKRWRQERKRARKAKKNL